MIMVCVFHILSGVCVHMTTVSFVLDVNDILHLCSSDNEHG